MGRKYETRRAWVKMTHSNPYYTQQGTGNRPRRVNCRHLVDLSSKCEMYIQVMSTHPFTDECDIEQRAATNDSVYKRPTAKVSWNVSICVVKLRNLPRVRKGVGISVPSMANYILSRAAYSCHSSTCVTWLFISKHLWGNSEIAEGSRLFWHQRWSGAQRADVLWGFAMTLIQRVNRVPLWTS